MEQRIIELKFYVIIKKLYHHFTNTDFLLKIIGSLRALAPYDPLVIERYIYLMLNDQKYMPYAGELVAILYKKTKVPIRDIVQAAGISNSTIYQLNEHFDINEFTVHTVIQPEDMPHIQQFLIAYNKLKRGL